MPTQSVNKKDFYILKRKGHRGQDLSVDTREHPEVLKELEQ